MIFNLSNGYPPSVLKPTDPITPTEVGQVINPADKECDGFSQVIVEPIPDDYVIPAGSTNIDTNGSHNISGLASVNVNVPIPDGYVNTSDATLASNDNLLEGSIAYGQDGVKYEGAMPNVGRQVSVIDNKEDVITIQNGYHNGTGTVSIDKTNLDGANILSGKPILGVPGEIPDKSAATVELTTSKSVVIPDGYYHNGAKVVVNDSDLKKENIRSGVNILGVSGTFPSGSDLATVNKTYDVTSLKTLDVNVPLLEINTVVTVVNTGKITISGLDFKPLGYIAAVGNFDGTRNYNFSANKQLVAAAAYQSKRIGIRFMTNNSNHAVQLNYPNWGNDSNQNGGPTLSGGSYSFSIYPPEGNTFISTTYTVRVWGLKYE